jgi:hypothetical protein
VDHVVPFLFCSLFAAVPRVAYPATIPAIVSASCPTAVLMALANPVVPALGGVTAKRTDRVS